MLSLLVFAACFLSAFGGAVKSDPPPGLVIHATNNTAVPSIHYIVDAVECLRQAFSVYTDPASQAEVYAELFQEKHNETNWSVIVGYSAYYIKSQYYIETTVLNGDKKSKEEKKDSKDDKNKETLYLLFSSS